MRCAADSACPPNTYCSDGDCVEGCKVTDPDECPLTMDGRRQLCDPDTHDCTLAAVCCGADDTCDAVLPGACRGDVLEGVPFCTNPNPCEGRCAAEAEALAAKCHASSGLATAVLGVDRHMRRALGLLRVIPR
jgi:hypothetical protein